MDEALRYDQATSSLKTATSAAVCACCKQLVCACCVRPTQTRVCVDGVRERSYIYVCMYILIYIYIEREREESRILDRRDRAAEAHEPSAARLRLILLRLY